MELNRQTYLSWQMAALDGELSPQELLRWEAFLAENPDLQAEAAAWEWTKLVPDETLPVLDKTSLYRSGNAINSTNKEEWFSQYTDEALSADDRAAVELYVLQHPEEQQSFLLHQATRLPVETLVFPDKQSLYRKEERRRPVVLWMGRLAVAAVLTGLVFALYTLGPAPQPPQQDLAQGNTNGQSKVVRNATSGQLPNSENAADGSVETAGISPSKALTAATNIDNSTALAKGQGSISARPLTRGQVGQQAMDKTMANNALTSNGNKKAESTINGRDNGVQSLAANTDKAPASANLTAAAFDTNADAIEVTAVSLPQDKEALQANVQPAVYRELDNDASDKSLYL
ncbi:MAG: hypothetical protein EAZ62_06675, partial [Sphingobacteriia bacterium]